MDILLGCSKKNHYMNCSLLQLIIENKSLQVLTRRWLQYIWQENWRYWSKIHKDMKAENVILLQSIPQGCIMEMDIGYDDTISCAEVVSVSASCSRCSCLASFLLLSHCYLTHMLHGLHIAQQYIYSLVSLHFTNYTIPYLPLKFLPKYNLSSSLRL